MDVNEFRAAGHKVVDRLAEYFESIESKAVFPNADPKVIRGLFNEPLLHAAIINVLISTSKTLAGALR